jgi:hypothetical protein
MSHQLSGPRRDDTLSICDVVRIRFAFAAMRDRAMARTRMTPSLRRGWPTLDDGARVVRIPLSIGDLAKGMEHLWSQADATVGNRLQMTRARKWLKQGETVAVGCDRLPRGPDGKEGVDGSSPSECYSKSPAN